MVSRATVDFVVLAEWRNVGAAVARYFDSLRGALGQGTPPRRSTLAGLGVEVGGRCGLSPAGL